MAKTNDNKIDLVLQKIDLMMSFQNEKLVKIEEHAKETNGKIAQAMTDIENNRLDINGLRIIQDTCPARNSLVSNTVIKWGSLLIALFALLTSLK